MSRWPSALINSSEAVTLSRDAAKDIVGEAKVWVMDYASLGVEDFAYYAQQIPSSYIRIGSHPQNKEAHPLHSSEFDFDEEAITIGANYFAKVATVAGSENCGNSSRTD